MTHPTSIPPLTGEALHQLLAVALPGAEIDMRDDTHKHLEHNEMVDHHGAHFWVKIIWSGFEGMARLARHKHVHKLLEQQWDSRAIHSLSLRLMTADEAAATLRR